MADIITLPDHHFRQSSSERNPNRPPPPQKPKNIDRRTREHLSEAEVEKLMAAAKGVGRHGKRDAAMILLAYRHGLRVGELVALRWEQLDLTAGVFHVRRLKNGSPTTHPLWGSEVRALRVLERDYPDTPYVFVTERKGPLTARAFRSVVMRAGKLAGFDMPIHPHMLRHSIGYKLANAGVDTRAIQLFLGHKNIQHTVRYTELDATRFNGFFGD